MKTKLNASIQCVQDRPQDVSNDENDESLCHVEQRALWALLGANQAPIDLGQ